MPEPRLESIRDLKSGSIRETLGIRISDELGVRPCELYSGGNGFGIDFAIHVASSNFWLTAQARVSARSLSMRDPARGTGKVQTT